LRLFTREQECQGFGIGIGDVGETFFRRHRGSGNIFKHAASDVLAQGLGRGLA